ncbi:MAG: prephenate dehydrogenase/arogenate dehydrogenase family protein [Methylococcaceae bacterium]|nr:prephenate dehydrogenase/arogenate dehydrogenase family protein [Methylococcaceae bacterium]
MFNKLCIIGPGLIGGSIARAARQRDLCNEIVGYGRPEDVRNLIKGKELKVIDDFYSDIAPAVAEANLVVIATPVGSIDFIFEMLKPIWNNETIYTDVGSTKANVINAAKRVFGKLPENFIPAHPIAGAEQSGIEASLADLFVNKRLIITPEEDTNSELLQKVTLFWERLGAQVSIMSSEHHDAVFAATSHLPHVLAFALVNMLGRKDEKTEIFKYAASGFKDFTRIASSDPTMWLDICLANKDEIIPLIEQLQDELNNIQKSLKNDNKQQLLDTFNYARQSRQRFLDLFEN